jgi:AcrR family transcriptional regulator
MGTKEKITQKALELFNQNGIEYVGMRELAASLGMQIGNITYYFPTKNDLVNQLALDLSALNEKTLASPGNPTLFSFLEMRERNFKNQHAYRCLFLSFVHIIKQNPLIAERYKNVEKARGDGAIDYIKMLQKQGYLKIESDENVLFLTSTIGLIARFWISEAAISYNHLPFEQQIRHYSGLIARMLSPYATKSGRIQIESFLNK